jgi:hypothetical protein
LVLRLRLRLLRSCRYLRAALVAALEMELSLLRESQLYLQLPRFVGKYIARAAAEIWLVVWEHKSYRHHPQWAMDWYWQEATEILSPVPGCKWCHLFPLFADVPISRVTAEIRSAA